VILRIAAVVQGENRTVQGWVNMPNRNFLIGKKTVTAQSHIFLTKATASEGAFNVNH